MDADNQHIIHRNRNHSSRPTTPLRPPSRSSVREAQSHRDGRAPARQHQPPLANLEMAFAELSEYMVDLEANFMHLHIMHESIARFSESFASFLYGLNMNAFCVDFPEAPVLDSFERASHTSELTSNTEASRAGLDGDTSFLTTDTSFITDPKPPLKVPPHQAGSKLPTNSHPLKYKGSVHRDTVGRGRSRETHRSGLARPKTTGAKYRTAP
ncbi:hypothetical protein L228DRAFT_251768 [Xylona heveae TC161]|uniref:DASH complex subunit DAM1 n=1 Tax=Xylona heveae (strain CBS 132557 / TC161) TaxID=1328760 RepID=A0A164ZBH4_XYLHT|nr:hypothetical protein L228DRAFT_251768 [Xylona heveae TC161]KZF18898.1 hypothetical protein L228DRAFT_251768 [Xylona heveae TC161]